MGRIQKACLLWVMLFLATIAFSSQGNWLTKPFPQPFEGVWQYSEELTPILKVQVEKVATLSRRGQLRLQQLKKQNYSCRHVLSGVWRCSRQASLDKIADEIRTKLESQMSTFILNFIPTTGSVEGIHNGNEYKAWRVHRPVKTEKGEYNSYEWTWTPELSKVILRSATREIPTVYLNLDDSLNISQQHSVNRTVDRNRFEIHVIRAHFQKVEDQ